MPDDFDMFAGDARPKPAATCHEMARRVGELKAKLHEQLLGEIAFPSNDHFLRQALGEAEALAWLTSFPHLFLPVLAEEKVQSVRAWHGCQQQFLAREEVFTTNQTNNK